ncbi:hypothetical protein Bca52824_045663 [Brassica carinata]|uniref:Uncharacterized protein n=1 Tax=Brassica carinata TaxID=52824 RepID=A0A8X7RIL4_BRACI|nr:hypothetical protein Bca52824_045663 [Brassica carinata]
MDWLILSSTVDGSNPRPWSAVRCFRTRRLGSKSAARLDPRPSLAPFVTRPVRFKPRCTAAARPQRMSLSDRIPRPAFVRSTVTGLPRRQAAVTTIPSFSRFSTTGSMFQAVSSPPCSAPLSRPCSSSESSSPSSTRSGEKNN